jgi:hypothetical protein
VRAGQDGRVRLERKHAVLLLAIAAWNVFSYATFARNLYAAHERGEDRPTGYWFAHIVLIIVNLVIAAALGRLGVRSWRATRRRDTAESVS